MWKAELGNGLGKNHSEFNEEPKVESTLMNAPSELVLTVKEVAQYLRVNQRTVYRLAVDRKLPGFKVGATWRFKRTDIDGWIAAQSIANIGG